MRTNKKNIFVWSPFTGKVGTVQNVLNTLYSINKYSEFETNLINSFGEWDNYIESHELKKVLIHNFKTLRFLKKWDIKGFLSSRFSYLLIFSFSFFPLLRLLKKQNPDYLIAHLISSLPLLIFNLFNFRTKLILHVAGHPKLNFVRKLLWKLSSKNIYRVICPSEELKQVFIDNNIFNTTQVIVIEDPHLIIKKVNKLSQKRVDDEFFNEGKILIAIGRMTKQKNYPFLIKNFHKLLNKFDDIKLIIIGDGEQKEELTNLIQKLNISNKVKLMGYENNIYKYLKKSNYYVSTSIWEGSSLAMIDAAYMGIPILCSNCPSGRKEFIGKNERGFLFRQNDSEDFLNSFTEMYSSYPNDMQTILLKAKRRTKNFTSFNNFLKFSEILN